MSRCLIIGKPNVGKTCFTLNFAEYLGLKKIKMTIQQPAGYLATQTFEIKEAREELISTEPNKTRSLKYIDLNLPMGKGKGKLTLIDSCGLADGIHPDLEIRKAMSQTIRQISESEIILHVIDLARLDQGKFLKISLIDDMLLKYVQSPQAYAILANKIDLEYTRKGLDFLRKELKKIIIIPISALYQLGFREVQSFVWRNL